ncbi:hypothetical protein EV191_102170 [Tamaricihabitans halophyticus]|uniref:Butirosin biosynthesis protein H-like n=1 Tax=Tamaricihabitans halophyticus TaxID=1262583 RepID=A0A4R2R093_9PSEU|nr:hypothetical protein [Tamaricihabitans halophyticus]TCP54959.1 hypothetical protein EV191_102170 [Tamaricihabitans halophyticus]
MTDIPYQGSGPYCYANSLVMLMGNSAPDASLVEVCTGSPFGMNLLYGKMPFFDPYGWTPELGIDSALTALGWTARTTSGGTAAAALDRLRSSLVDGPVLVGPLEMGHLRYQPSMTGPIGADHYAVVLAMEADWLIIHDPQGYPYARLPVPDFLRAWQADTVDYGEQYTMRTDVQVRASIPPSVAVRTALSWVNPAERTAPAGTLANAEAALALADRLEHRPDDEIRENLVHFAIRVGTRRLADAAFWLAQADLPTAAAVTREQARLVGALQYPLATEDVLGAAGILRELAPTYQRLREAVADAY